MKRLLNFLLIGPLLGYVIFILRNIAGGKLIDGMIGFLFGCHSPISSVCLLRYWCGPRTHGCGIKSVSGRRQFLLRSQDTQQA